MTRPNFAQELNLEPHPEGGRFREVHRSPDRLTTPDGRERDAMTHIYFHLAVGERSAFHRVRQEEVWNLYHGGPLHLWLFDERTRDLREVVLSAVHQTYCAVIPAGIWQAAEPMERQALAGCTVAPGFDFADFELMTPDHPVADDIRGLGLDRLLSRAGS